MDDENLFYGFEFEEERLYAQEAVERWGDEAAQSIRRWHAYGKKKQDSIREEGDSIYRDMTGLIGQDPGSPLVQQVIRRWHQHLRYFYEPSKERMIGLADMYAGSAEFKKTFDQFHPDLAQFLRIAIHHYCAQLE